MGSMKGNIYLDEWLNVHDVHAMYYGSLKKTSVVPSSGSLEHCLSLRLLDSRKKNTSPKMLVKNWDKSNDIIQKQNITN